MKIKFEENKDCKKDEKLNLKKKEEKDQKHEKHEKLQLLEFQTDAETPKNRNRRASWDRSIRSGGKGRTTFDEMLDKVVCPKSFSSDFLAVKHHKVNRAKYRHTYLTDECCTSNGGNTFEVMQSNLNEECCNEGCRYEEVLENCDSWRWDEIDDGASMQL